MSDHVLTVEDVNRLDRDAFVATFGHVYEATPALASSAWQRRPFVDRLALVTAFEAVAEELDDAAVLSLLRAHPQLGARVPMTADSQREQRSAGLVSLDEQARDEIASGNARYLEQFGFPFIIAVRGRQPAEIAAALSERLHHDAADEQATALEQVKRIAVLRIAELVNS